MRSFMEVAATGETTAEFDAVCRAEGLGLQELCAEVAHGRLVIVPNRGGGPPVALGRAARSKVLCNLGTSSESSDIESEIEKARIALRCGATIICDQSVGSNVEGNRKRLLDAIAVPIAAVPLYQNVDEAKRSAGDALAFSGAEVLEVFERQLDGGVTMPGIHSMTKEVLQRVGESGRLMPIVSRGGGIMSAWIKRTGKENVYFEKFDQVLAMVKNRNVPLTFVASLRSGTVVDGFDSCEEMELRILRPYIEEAHRSGVSVVVDGLGHCSINFIPDAVRAFKEICCDVPLGVLGPAVTDRGLGHEHIVNAIGTAVAVWSGANYCNACYRTEHLGLPELQDIAEGISASVVATYAGDLARESHHQTLMKEERAMSYARKKNQWGVMLHQALDNDEAMRTFQRVGERNVEGKGCSICGDLCPFVVTGQC